MLIVLLGIVLAVSAVAFAQSLLKPYEEGFAASRSGRPSVQMDGEEKDYLEGDGYLAAGAQVEATEPKSAVPEG